MAEGLAARSLRGLRLAAGAILDLVWPPVCAACRAGLEPGPGPCLCQACRAELPLTAGRACRRCGMPLGPFENDNSGRYCTDCGALSLVFRRTASAGLYEGPLAAVIRSYKYTPRARRAHLAGFLADLLADRLLSPDCGLDVGEADLIVPVPAHRARRRQRGFDSAAGLARALGHRLGLPVETSVLLKTRSTRPQMGLSRAARLGNLKGSFAVRRPEAVRGRLVLLVDDVMTTCATAEECARTLKLAGASEIRVAVVARAPEGRTAAAGDPGASSRN